MDVLNETPLQPGWMILPLPGRSFAASFALKGTYRLKPGAPAVPAEAPQDLEGDVPEEEGSTALRYTRDLTAPKVMTDLLVWGDAFAPQGKPVDMMPVTVRIGAWTKVLAVLGDRVRTQGMLWSKTSPPAPFTRMPLRWSRAYGGMDFAKNPAGRGLDAQIDEAGTTFFRLPNIVRLEEAGLEAGALKDPAGLGPLSPEWDARSQIARRAHYGAKWLKERWPAPPEDFDPEFFSAAPPDQRVPLGTLRGNERLEFQNLHPARPKYESALPGLRPRLFLEETGANAQEKEPLFREIPLRIDTLWVDPSAETLILVWRGYTAVRSMKLKEVSAVVVGQEPLSSEPEPAAKYRQVLEAKRAAREKAQAAAPPAPPTFEPLEIPKPDLQVAALEKELAEDRAAEMARFDAEARETDAQTRGAAAALLAKEGLPAGVVWAVPPQDPASVAAQAQKDFQAIAAVNPEAAKLLSQPPSAESLDVEAKVKAEIDAFEAEFAQPFFPPGPDAPPDSPDGEAQRPGWTRERVAAHAALGKTFEKEDLQGLDLSGLDLSGAQFQDCVLAGCSLRNAKLDRAGFLRSSLAEAKLTGASLAAAAFRFADLAGSDWTGARLEKTVLDDSDCSGAVFDGCHFSGVSAVRTVFGEARFKGATLKDSTFREADFQGAMLDGVSLGGSSFRSANAYGVHASNTDFEGCDLGNFRAGDGAAFEGSVFRNCKAPGSVWEGAGLRRANFSSADLRRANFSGASLQEAKFGKAKLAQARFVEADLSKAELQSADLFRASFEGAIVSGADFRLSSAYEAEFLNTTGNGAHFDGANLKGTKLA